MSMKTRDQILADNPLQVELARRGVALTGRGTKLRADRCPTKQHSREDTVSVDVDKQVFNCFACGHSGSVIDWIAIADNKTVADVMKELGANDAPVAAPASRVLVQTYYYRNANGEKIYKVCRYEPKTFRPFHLRDGKPVAGLEGVTRVLYNLPEIIEADTVIVVEGEKDADNLNKLELGAVATTNCSGAESWLDSYSDALKDKHVIVMPDQDEKGEKHAQKVIGSIIGKAKTVRRVNMPKPHKDVSDFIAATGEQAKEKLCQMIAEAKVIRPGHDLPFKDILDLEQDYREHVKNLETHSINLSQWLPSLRCLRKLVAGDLVAVLADTGSGKTSILVNLIRHANPIPTISFELELGEAMVFERFVQSDAGLLGIEVEGGYQSGNAPTWNRKGLSHFLHCTETRLTPEKVEELIEKAELRLGKRPLLVTIDYIGLMNDDSARGERYEQLSNVVEKLRMIAKRTKTVIVIASQVKRRQDADNTTPIGLHDAKNTGSIENSASVVIGAWRDENDRQLLNMAVLKASRGGAGVSIKCNFDGAKMQITERAMA